MRHEKEQYQVLQRESENEQSDNDSIHKQEESKSKYDSEKLTTTM